MSFVVELLCLAMVLQASPRLIERFKEREENVKVCTIEHYHCVLVVADVKKKFHHCMHIASQTVGLWPAD
jgi:hypothetical protein